MQYVGAKGPLLCQLSSWMVCADSATGRTKAEALVTIGRPTPRREQPLVEADDPRRWRNGDGSVGSALYFGDFCCLASNSRMYFSGSALNSVRQPLQQT